MTRASLLMDAGNLVEAGADMNVVEPQLGTPPQASDRVTMGLLRSRSAALKGGLTKRASESRRRSVSKDIPVVCRPMSINYSNMIRVSRFKSGTSTSQFGWRAMLSARASCISAPISQRVDESRASDPGPCADRARATR